MQFSSKNISKYIQNTLEMKKNTSILIALLLLISTSYAQKLPSNYALSILNNNDFVFVSEKMPYNPSVPYFVNARNNTTFYGMSTYTLYLYELERLDSSVDLLDIDESKLSVGEQNYVTVYVKEGGENFVTGRKDSDGNEKTTESEIFSFDTKEGAEKFIQDLKICIKLSNLLRVKIYHTDLSDEKTVEENAKKQIAYATEGEKLIIGKKYTSFNIILSSKKFKAHEAVIHSLVEYDTKSKMLITKNSSQDSEKKIYDNLDKMKKLRSNATTNYKPFIDDYYPGDGRRKDWEPLKSYYELIATGGYLELFPATLAEYQTKNAQTRGNLNKMEQDSKKATTINTSTGNSVLMDAIKAQDVEKVKMFLENNADPLYVNPKTNQSVLQLAIETQNIAIITQIMNTQQYNYNSKIDIRKETMEVVKSGNVQIVQLLKVSQLQNKLFDGLTASMVAYQSGHIPMTAYLLKRMTDAYYKESEKQNEKDGMTVLMMICEKGDIKALTELKSLIINDNERGNMTNNEGFSALMIASQKGHKEIVEMLLQSKRFSPTASGDKGKGYRKSAIDVAQNKEIKNLLKKAAN